MEDTHGDAFRRIQELLEQMIRDSMENGDPVARPMGFTIVIRGSGPIPGGPDGRIRENGGASEPLVEVHEGDEEVLVLGELPGISEDQVTLDLKGDVLRISASDGTRSFAGRARLPPVDPDSLSANLRNGVLEVRLRRIPGTAR